MNKSSKQCEMCAYYVFDDEYNDYICNMSMDEDELASLYTHKATCPYFRFYDEYKMVRKQN